MLMKLKKLTIKKVLIKTLGNSQALSLLEILISLTLLALAGTFIGGRVFESLHEGKVSSARIQMQNLAARLKEFRRHCGKYPTTEQGLEALIEKPTSGPECKRYAPGGYIEEGNVPKDPWGNDFDYVSENNGQSFNIICHGANGIEGGEGHDKDIYLYEDKNQESNE